MSETITSINKESEIQFCEYRIIGGDSGIRAAVIIVKYWRDSHMGQRKVDITVKQVLTNKWQYARHYNQINYRPSIRTWLTVGEAKYYLSKPDVILSNINQQIEAGHIILTTDELKVVIHV